MEIKKMIPNPWNYNEMTEEDYQAMKQGIKENYEKGLSLWIGDKVLVCELDDLIKPYRIIEGEHRVKACEELGIKEIPDDLILNLGKGIPEVEQRRLTEIKNIRGTKNPIRYAKFLKGQLELEKVSQREFAQKRQMSEKTLSKILKRAEVPDSLIEKISHARIPDSTLDEILLAPKEKWEGMVNYYLRISPDREELREAISTAKIEEGRRIPTMMVEKVETPIQVQEFPSCLCKQCKDYEKCKGTR